MNCPECGKVLSKNPKHAEGVWECKAELGCGETWFVLNIPRPPNERKKKGA